MPWGVKDVGEHKKGLTQEQKRKWVKTANSVLSKCLKEGGTDETCAPKAIRIANGVINNNSMETTMLQITVNTTDQMAYTVKTKTVGGREYIVVPVVMIMEGVHNGSRGPILHLEEELKKSVGEWEGKPVTISHPQVDGAYVSVDFQQVLQQCGVGEVHDVFVKDKKLKGSIWLDTQKLTAISPDILESIQNNEIIEVSIGVFSEEEKKDGEWNGEKYIAVSRNYTPDHLALLPGGIGACSVTDGCGIRVNKQKGGKEDVNLDEIFNVLIKKGYVVSPMRNEASFSGIMDQIYNLTEGMSDSSVRIFPEEVYKDYFIYRKRKISQSSNGELLPVEDVALFKQNYQIGADDKVALVGDPVEVKKEVSYITLQENLQKDEGTKFNNNKKKEEKSMCKPCKEKANALIANANTHFEENDREWLEGLTEDKLDKMIPKMVKVNKTEKPEVTAEQAWNVLGLNKEQYEMGVTFYNEQRTATVDSILANTEEGVWTKEELEGMKLGVLKKMEKSVKKEQPGNYTGVSVGGGGTEKSIEPMPLPGVEFENGKN